MKESLGDFQTEAWRLGVESLCRADGAEKAKPGLGKKPAKRSARKPLMNCPCREAKAE
jgi:hypothetical protein